jgi:hypothetical protein
MGKSTKRSPRQNAHRRGSKSRAKVNWRLAGEIRKILRKHYPSKYGVR